MNLKSIFGAVLTILGIVALIYGAYTFLNASKTDWKTLIVSTFLGLIFFSAGIKLVKGIKDEA